MDYSARTPNQLGNVLRGYRRQQHLSQRQTGSRVGLLPKTISALESEPGRSSVESLFRLLSALNLELVLREKGLPAESAPPGKW